MRDGAPAHLVARQVAYAAALRLARFATSNEVTDWFNPQHTFVYCNGAYQAVKRSPTPDVVRGVFHGAMSVYMDRYLNVPPARLPSERNTRDDLPATADGLRRELLTRTRPARQRRTRRRHRVALRVARSAVAGIDRHADLRDGARRSRLPLVCRCSKPA